MLTPKPTADQIRDYRDEHECGLLQAKAELADIWLKTNLVSIKVLAEQGYDAHRLIAMLATLMLEGK
jgi:hypothetical protein